jgi:hypothetical protein
MKQNQLIIGKECIIGQKKGLILDAQEDIAIIALKDIHEECTFETAKKDIPKDAYIPEAWEMLKYIKYLRKYWPMKRTYWSSQLHYQNSDYSFLYGLYLGTATCFVDGSNVDSGGHLFAGYFIKVPIEHLEIIK